MITALVPIKTESERLLNKNFLNFCGQPLYQVVLDTLQSVEIVKNMVINTDSELIAKDCEIRYSKAIIIKRPDYLLGNSVTMNSIIENDLKHVIGEHFLQTHVTNPLLTASTIQSAILKYFQDLDVFDSLFSVERIKKRIYDYKGNGVNHSNKILLQTQELPEVNIENSNLFIFSRTSFYRAGKSRIGLTPQMFKMSVMEGIDIDYEEDFQLATIIAENKKRLIGCVNSHNRT